LKNRVRILEFFFPQVAYDLFFNKLA
jgi:hypothetical protein